MAASASSTLLKKDLERIIYKCSSVLGYEVLETKQVEVIMSFAQGKDTFQFVALPTGYRKSLI